MLKEKILLCAFLIFCVFAFSMSADDASEQSGGGIPEWVKNPPADSDEFVYFSGQGFDAEKNTTKARELAIDDLVSGIMRFTGVRIHSEVSTEAVATADSFESLLRKNVTQSGGARVTGFQIIRRWIQTMDAGVTVYILARYNKDDLLKEKARLEKLFQETIDSVAVPEREGDELYRQGKYFEAVVRFLQATLAASESDLENKEIYVNRNIDNAMRALERINFFALNNNLTFFVGAEIKEPFRLKVAAGPAADTRGVGEVALRFTYKKLQNNQKRTETAVIKTDAAGNADFIHPVCKFVGGENVVVTLSLESYLKKLDDMPARYRAKVDGLKRLFLTKRVVFDFTVVSRAADVPIGIVVADLDSGAQYMEGSRQTASGIMEVLTQNDFNIKTIPVKSLDILYKGDKEALALLKKNAGGAERAVYGSAQAGEAEKSGSRYIVKATGSVKVVDLATGNILFEKTLSRNGLGSSPESARGAAFKQLGRELGKALAAGVK
jgi:hypothetical protein